MDSSKLRVTVDLGRPELAAKYMALIGNALELAFLYRNALAAVPWPAFRNLADYGQGGDAWNRPVSIDAWEREYEQVRQQALRESAEQAAEFAALRTKWDAIPWEAINEALLIAQRTHVTPIAEKWYWANAPEVQK